MGDGKIDVVADFVCDSVNQQYNRDYIAWRRNTKSRCAYRYVDNAREKVFVEGKPQAKKGAAHAERKALSYTAEMIGIGLLVLMICDLGVNSVLIWAFRLLDLDIQIDFLTFSMSGDQWMVTAVRILIVLLKFGIPFVLLMRFFRLPARVAMPASVGGMAELLAAVGAGLLCSAVYAANANAGGIDTMQNVLNYKEPAAVVAYWAFDITAASLLAELLLRGAILPVLRQFGDLFAVCLTAGIAFLFPDSPDLRIGELMIGLASGYLLIRGGSFWKCVLLRVIYAGLGYARLWIVYSEHIMSLPQYLLLLAAAGCLLLGVYALLRRKRLRLQNRRSALPLRAKLMTFIQTVTILPWLGASALLLLLQIFY